MRPFPFLSSVNNALRSRYFLMLIALILSLCFVSGTQAQNAPPIEWQKCLGGSNYDYTYSIQQTADGGFIVAGSSYSSDGNVSENHGQADYWIVKLDTAGNIVWQKSLGGSENDFTNSIQQTTDGGFIIAGYAISNDGNVSGNHGESDGWIVKLDTSGNIVWQKCLGGSSYDYAYSIQQTTDGGFIVAGYTSSNDGDISGNHGYTDGWIVKLDALGNLLWQKCLGGSNLDNALSIQQTTDGGFITTGYTSSNDGDVSGNHGYEDAWIIKLDADGNLVWQKCAGGSYQDFAFSVQQTSDAEYVVAGYTYSNDGDVSGNHGASDDWVIRLDADGNLLWQKCLGGTNIDEAHAIQQTTDGGFIVAGYSYSNNGEVSGNHGSLDCWIVRLNINGRLVWQKSLGGSDMEGALSIRETTDGGFIVGASTLSNDGDVSGNHGEDDVWIVKLSGEAQSCLNPTGLSVTDISATSAQLNWTIQGTPDHFRVVYRSENAPRVTTTMPGSASSLTIANLTPNTTYLWGVEAGCGSESSSLVHGKRFRTALTKTAEDADLMFTSLMNLYPNPSNGVFTLDLQTEEWMTTSVIIQIMNVLGQVIYTEAAVPDHGMLQKEIQLSDAADGMYLVKVSLNDRVYTSQIYLRE